MIREDKFVSGHDPTRVSAAVGSPRRTDLATVRYAQALVPLFPLGDTLLLCSQQRPSSQFVRSHRTSSLRLRFAEWAIQIAKL
jgi:hypothetical protein